MSGKIQKPYNFSRSALIWIMTLLWTILPRYNTRG